MNMKVNYIEHQIIFEEEKINVFEIENKKLFYRFINDLYRLKNGELVEEFIAYNEKNEEINISKNIHILINYFNLELDAKKIITDANKIIIEQLDEKDILDFSKIYKKISNKMNSVINRSEMPLLLDDEFSVEMFFKLIKTTIKKESELINNLLILIDINKIIRNNQILIFINLKEYLSKQELIELYKYAMYNSVKIILIDSKAYGICLKYESKIIIDENLNEYMLQ